MHAIITEVIGTRATIGANYGIDPLILTSEQRASGHFVATTAGGRQLRVSLPRGVELQDGDVLACDGDWAITVTAASEELIFFQPCKDPVLWAAACYQLGNLHRPARFLPEGVLTPVDAMVMSHLKAYGMPFEVVRRPFVGRRFAAVHSHDHHRHGEERPVHGHGHGHEHSREAVRP